MRPNALTAVLLALRIEPGKTRADLRERAESKLSDIDEKIKFLREMRKSLAKLTKVCSGDGPVSFSLVKAFISSSRCDSCGPTTRQRSKLCQHLRPLKRRKGTGQTFALLAPSPTGLNEPTREEIERRQAGEAAAAQGKFGEMHDYLFKHRYALDDKYLLEYIERIVSTKQNYSKFAMQFAILGGLRLASVWPAFPPFDRTGIQGEPNSGVFLQPTSDDAHDVNVPTDFCVIRGEVRNRFGSQTRYAKVILLL